jgi:hypothetical protein
MNFHLCLWIRGALSEIGKMLLNIASKRIKFPGSSRFLVYGSALPQDLPLKTKVDKGGLFDMQNLCFLS